MANFKRLGKNTIWLARTLPAFTQRYDDLGQQNPLAPERIEEMWAVIKMFRRTINEVYNANEQRQLHHALDYHTVLLARLVDLDRNATPEEVLQALSALNATTKMMINIEYINSAAR